MAHQSPQKDSEADRQNYDGLHSPIESIPIELFPSETGDGSSEAPDASGNYQEIMTTSIVPTKLDDGTNSIQQDVQSSRPSSSGEDTPLAAGDEEFLKTHTVERSEDTVVDVRIKTFERPKSSGDINAGFSFQPTPRKTATDPKPSSPTPAACRQPSQERPTTAPQRMAHKRPTVAAQLNTQVKNPSQSESNLVSERPVSPQAPAEQQLLLPQPAASALVYEDRGEGQHPVSQEYQYNAGNPEGAGDQAMSDIRSNIDTPYEQLADDSAQQLDPPEISVQLMAPQRGGQKQRKRIRKRRVISRTTRLPGPVEDQNILFTSPATPNPTATPAGSGDDDHNVVNPVPGTQTQLQDQQAEPEAAMLPGPCTVADNAFHSKVDNKPQPVHTTSAELESQAPAPDSDSDGQITNHLAVEYQLVHARFPIATEVNRQADTVDKQREIAEDIQFAASDHAHQVVAPDRCRSSRQVATTDQNCQVESLIEFANARCTPAGVLDVPTQVTVTAPSAPASRPASTPGFGTATHEDRPRSALLGDARVAKRSSTARGPKPSRRPTKTSANAINNTSFVDMLKILEQAVQEDKDRAVQGVESELEETAAELQNMCESVQALQNQLETSQAQETKLSTELEDRRRELTKLSNGIRNFQKFMKGLGNDCDGLRSDNREHRRLLETVTEGLRDLRKDVGGLIHQVSVAMGKSSRVNKANLELNRDYEAKVRELTQKNVYIDQQLSEKVGILSEERDRRVALEKQLEAQNNTQTTLNRLVESCTEKLLDKLHLIHAEIDEEWKDSRLADLLAKCQEEVQALKEHQPKTLEEVNVLKGLVETFSTTTYTHLNKIANVHCESPDAISALESRISEGLRGVHDELKNRDDLLAKDAAQQESITALEERLKTSDAKITELTAQLSENSAFAHEAALKQILSQFEARVVASQVEHPIPADSTGATVDRIYEALAENQKLKQEMGAVRGEAASAVKKLTEAAAARESMQNELEELQRRLGEAQTAISELNTQRTELQAKASMLVADEKIDKLHEELGKTAEKLIQEQQVAHRNEIHQLNLRNEKINKQLTNASGEVEPVKTENQLLKEQLASKVSEIHRSAQKAADSQAQVKRLEQTLKDQKKEAVATVEEKISTLTAGLASKDASLQQVNAEKETAVKLVEELQRTVNQLQASKDEAASQLQTYREEAAENLREAEKKAAEDLSRMQKRLSDVEQARREAGSLATKLRKDAEAAIMQCEDKSNRDKDSLQQRLAEVDGELKRKESELQRVRKEAEDGLLKATESHKADVADFKRRLSEAMREGEQLRHTSSEQLTQLASQKQAPPPERVQRAEVSPLKRTPETTQKGPEPRTPKKKVDRTTNTVHEVPPPAVPEQLRDSHLREATPVSNPSARHTIIEESQNALDLGDPFVDVDYDAYAAASGRQDSDASMLTAGDFQALEPLNVPGRSHQQATEEIEETQSQGVPLTFAAFSDRYKSAPPETRDEPESDVVEDVDDLLSQTHNYMLEDVMAGKHQESNALTPGKHTHNAISVLESSLTGRPDSRAPPAFTTSQAISAFAKTYAPPNSASKVVPRQNAGPLEELSQSAAQSRGQSRTDAQFSKLVDTTFGGQGDAEILLSKDASSPDYVLQGAKSQMRSTYGRTRFGSANSLDWEHSLSHDSRRTERKSSVSVSEAVTTRRTNILKRQSTDQVVEDRSTTKRMRPNDGATPRALFKPSRPGLRSSGNVGKPQSLLAARSSQISQPAQLESGMVSSVGTTRSRSSRTAAAAAKSQRDNILNRKSTRNTQYEERFSQELDHRQR